MMRRRAQSLFALFALTIAAGSAVWGQPPDSSRSLRVHVFDSSGAVRSAVCELEGAPRPSRAVTDAAGVCIFDHLAAAALHVRVVSVGFRPAEVAVNTASAATTDARVVLHVFTATTVEVTASPENAQTGNAKQIRTAGLDAQILEQPARALIGAVALQPGWVLEANGVLHPRGSEYETQYIVDGVPVMENRSPAFAPPLDLSDVANVEIQTGGYPAEYGRKLGGVVEVHSPDHLPPGWHGAAEVQAGSFDTQRLALRAGFASRANSVQLDANGLRTSRYLDPPALENFHNGGNAAGGGLAFSHDFSQYRRLRVILRRDSSGFDVPNEVEQQLAGQRQSRQVGDTSAQLWYQQVLSPVWLLDVHASARDVAASLDANAASTPILPTQHRGLREYYGAASVAAHQGRHDFTFGTDYVRTALRERFQYQITDPSAFDPGVLPALAFAQHASGNQASWYAQDRISAGPLTVTAGLRWDYYDLLVQETAWSPRMAAAVRVPLGVVLRASYDRVFNTPAQENLLLASSAYGQQVVPTALRLAVRPANANFYEVGASKTFTPSMRVDVAAYRRDFRNFADDDVFLNTGVSFPIAFSSALIEGLEASIRLRMAQKFTSVTTYSNLSGTAQFPVTGGLFLDGDPALLQSHDAFRITQDQRNTATSTLRFDATSRLWLGATAWYGSGLPVELEGGTPAPSDPRILQRINFDRGRLRPSYAAGISAGAVLWSKELRSAQLQVAVDNLTNHLNVINFAALFSGTAIGAPRAVNVRFKYIF